MALEGTQSASCSDTAAVATSSPSSLVDWRRDLDECFREEPCREEGLDVEGPTAAGLVTSLDEPWWDSFDELLLDDFFFREEEEEGLGIVRLCSFLREDFLEDVFRDDFLALFLEAAGWASDDSTC